MDLGVLLRKKRKELHLSQQEMAADVLSYSYYSKVERGLHDINTMDLLKILVIHNIDIDNFFKELGFKSERDKWLEYLQKIQRAFYLQNIESLENISNEISNDTLSITKKEELKQLIIVLKYNVKNNIQAIPIETKRYFKSTFIQYDYWNDESLQIFAWSMTVYTNDELTFFVNKILREYKKRNTKTSYTSVLLSSIIVNYLVNIYQRSSKINDLSFIKRCWRFLNDLPYSENIGMYKMMGRSVLALIENDVEITENIIQSWRECGLNSLIERLPKK